MFRPSSILIRNTFCRTPPKMKEKERPIYRPHLHQGIGKPPPPTLGSTFEGWESVMIGFLSRYATLLEIRTYA